MTNPLILPLPCRNGDWVQNKFNHRIAKVRAVYRDSLDGAVLVDLWLYDKDGDRIGRTSPAMGGPRSYEPACDYSSWERIKKPSFPLRMRLQESGTFSYAMPTLPDGEFLPRSKKTAAVHLLKDASQNDSASVSLAHAIAADELAETIRIKGLDGAVKAKIEARIAELRRIAEDM